MLSRRSFLGSTLGAGAGLALTSQGPQPAAAQPAPRRMIVDSQIHVWKASTPERPWNPGAQAQMPEPFGYERLHAMMDEAGVGHAILVPPSWEGERIDYSLEAAQKFPNRFAVMGRFPINVPEERARLETWRQQKGMLGVRLTLPNPGNTLPGGQRCKVTFDFPNEPPSGADR